MQTDPIGYGDDFNLYAYTSNDPANNNDPRGQNATVVEEIVVTGSRAASATPWGFLVNVFLWNKTADKSQDQLYNSIDDARVFNEVKDASGDKGKEDESKSTDDLVDDLIGESTPGRETKGRTEQYDRPNGSNPDEDFNSLKPTNVQDRGGGVRSGTLQDGRTVVQYPKSSSGRPTVEIQGPGGRIKFRY